MSFLIESIRPKSHAKSIIFDSGCVLTGSLLIALCAHITIPLWFTPVPITMQMFAILLIPGLLGSTRGTLATVAYILEGILGFPFFSGGKSGIAVFASPTGSYLIGMIISSFVVGKILELGWNKKFSLTFITLLIGSVITLAIGSLGLIHFVGLKKAFTLGAAPFLAGDAFKAFAAAFSLFWGNKFLTKTFSGIQKGC